MRKYYFIGINRSNKELLIDLIMGGGEAPVSTIIIYIHILHEKWQQYHFYISINDFYHHI